MRFDPGESPGRHAGENWLDASWTLSPVSAKTIPATVMIAAATVPSSSLALSTVKRSSEGAGSRRACRSSSSIPAAKARPRTTHSTGTKNRLLRTASEAARRRTITRRDQDATGPQGPGVPRSGRGRSIGAVRRRRLAVGDTAAGRHVAPAECGRQAGGRLESDDLGRHLDAMGIERRLDRLDRPVKRPAQLELVSVRPEPMSRSTVELSSSTYRASGGGSATTPSTPATASVAMLRAAAMSAS